ncbi:hypothetical protein V1460_27760 [Streptomyces sp. SCSIO 30461]|uniref:hypothetical protein n=1 Tax=Streptomyces sp. SCSIO 30461 TaxID=3118085 RepID=UPI0030CDBFFD
MPILGIYRKHYGARMAACILSTFHASIVAAAYVVEFVFGVLGIIPDNTTAKIPDEGGSWDYTSWLNIVFLLLAAGPRGALPADRGPRHAARDGRRCGARRKGLTPPRGA